MSLPIFCDIDGTLTNTPTKKWGSPDVRAIACLKQLIKDGHEVVLWSGGGTKYVKEFAEKYDIKPSVCIGKPSMVIDDNSDIRPIQRIKVMSPSQLKAML
jgi:hydroxymethylpyrimidine pyrophosphatase-like HAD family hydrolase